MTPGPYHVAQDKGPPYIIAQGADWKRVATIKEQKDANETRCNSRLFAAAPDLLAACKAAALSMADMPHWLEKNYATVLSKMMSERLEAIRAAIAKATGA